MVFLLPLVVHVIESMAICLLSSRNLFMKLKFQSMFPWYSQMLCGFVLMKICSLFAAVICAPFNPSIFQQ